MIVFQDQLAYSQKCSVPPPTELNPTTFFDTNVRREFGRTIARYGVGIDVSLLPGIPIPRIDYAPETPLFETIAPYVTPFAPVVINASFSGEFYFDEGDDGYFSPANNPTAGSDYKMIPVDFVELIESPLAYRDITDVSASIEGEHVNQVKLLTGPPPGAGEISPNVDYTERRVDDDPAPGADGRTVLAGEIWWDLHEDEEHPEVTTRSVFMGTFSETRDTDGHAIENVETRHAWAADFQRLRQIVTTTGAEVDLPAVGRIYDPEARVDTQKTFWMDDPDNPGQQIRKSVDTESSGLAIVVNDADGVPIATSGVDAITATRSRTVDTSATSSQRWIRTYLYREYERYKSTGVDTASVLVTRYDALRGVSLPPIARQNIQKSSIRAEPAPIVEYRTNYDPRDERPLAAPEVDARLVGIHVAERIISRLFSGDIIPPALIATPTLWLEPGKYKQGTGWLLTGEGEEGGPAVITEIDYVFRIDPDLVANMTITLMRPGRSQ